MVVFFLLNQAASHDVFSQLYFSIMVIATVWGIVKTSGNYFVLLILYSVSCFDLLDCFLPIHRQHFRVKGALNMLYIIETPHFLLQISKFVVLSHVNESGSFKKL